MRTTPKAEMNSGKVDRKSFDVSPFFVKKNVDSRVFLQQCQVVDIFPVKLLLPVSCRSFHGEADTSKSPAALTRFTGGRARNF